MSVHVFRVAVNFVLMVQYLCIARQQTDLNIVLFMSAFYRVLLLCYVTERNPETVEF